MEGYNKVKMKRPIMNNERLLLYWQCNNLPLNNTSIVSSRKTLQKKCYQTNVACELGFERFNEDCD